jgi:MoxR-like ATPase
MDSSNEWLVAPQNDEQAAAVHHLSQAEFLFIDTTFWQVKPKITSLSGESMPKAAKVVTPEHIARARGILSQIYVDDKVKDYVLNIVFATREPAKAGLKDLQDCIEYGASPRATLSLVQAARAHAFLRHRGFVTPEDVKAIGYDVLRHRVTLTYEAEAEDLTPERIIQRVFDRVEVP